MTLEWRKATMLLFLGDIIVFLFSLWITLLIRYGVFPDQTVFLDHLGPFSVLFLAWTLIFYMAGLYNKQALLFKSELPGMLFRTQLLNIIFSALFFFFISVGIAPKTNLAIYLIVSLALIFFWRLSLYPRITNPSVRERAALIGSGPEVDELVKEVNANPRYHLKFDVIINPTDFTEIPKSLIKKLRDENVSVLIVDTEHKDVQTLLHSINTLAFGKQKYQFGEFYQIYEDVFDRVPLSLLDTDWFLKNISSSRMNLYAGAKRCLDIIGALVMGLITLVLIPPIFILMKIEGRGPLFLKQIRIGQHGSRVTAYKFRSMTFDNKRSGEWLNEEKQNKVTRVGAVLRRTSLDEFPQFLNILRGELSLVGPRNDIEGLGSRLAENIPYYMARYAVKPGITGWAQINQRYEPGHISPQSIEETKVRLAYDFYYIRHHSIGLDLVIVLKTFKRMLFRVSAW